MKIYFVVFVLLICGLCYGQNKVASKKYHYKPVPYHGTDPYKGKAFKPNDIRTMHLTIPVGNITISNDLTYQLIADNDGSSFKTDHTYRARIVKVTPTEADSNAIPKSLTKMFNNRVIDLTEKQIMSDKITTKTMFYFFSVDDYNLDGKPDFAFNGEPRYHAFPVKNYIWVNINGKLVYWYGLSNVCSDKENKATRMVSIVATGKAGIFAKYFYVVKDTFLVARKG